MTAPDPLLPGVTLLTAGAPVETAQAAVILLHGRGATAADILSLGPRLDSSHATQKLAFLAPQAPGRAWYPHHFLAPLAENEPALSAALATVGALIARIEMTGIPVARIALLGFSQGACLALEYAARHARRYGGVIALAGGLIGPPGTLFRYSGMLAGTSVFIGCGDSDPHIPLARVNESAEALAELGARVDRRIYPGLGHAIVQDEIDAARAILHALIDD